MGNTQSYLATVDKVFPIIEELPPYDTKDNPDLIVVVRCDRTVKFQEIVDVLDPLTELGIAKLNIAAIRQE